MHQLKAVRRVLKTTRICQSAFPHRASATMTETQSTETQSGQAREEPSGMEEHARLLTSLQEIPNISKCWLRPAHSGGLNLTVQYSQRDLPANTQRKYLQSTYIPKGYNGEYALTPSFPLELKDIQLLSVSPSGKRTLVARGGSDSTSTVLEVWMGNRVTKELHVPKKLHGSIFNDGWFGTGAAWNADESRVAYVAEAAPAVQTPAWGGLPKGSKEAQDSSDKDTTAGPKSWKGVGEYQEDWGELNTGKKPPALFVLDLKRWNVKPVKGLPANTSAGQPEWTPDGKSLVCTVWPHTATNMPSLPQRLGIVFCLNRPCALYSVKVPFTCKNNTPSDTDPKAQCLTEQVISVASAKFSPDGGKLIFVCHDAAASSGVHCATAKLMCIPWSAEGAKGEPQVVVDVVGTPKALEDFPGLYVGALPELPFLDDDTLVLTSSWRSCQAVLAVHVTSGAVQRLSTHDTDRSSWGFGATCQGAVVAVASSLHKPHSLQLRLPGAGSNSPDWVPLQLEGSWPYDKAVEEALPNCVHQILQVQPTNEPKLAVEAVLLHHKSAAEPRPTILMPHGGPHSCYPCSFFTGYTFLVNLGFNMVLVNFRGSLGFGEDSIQSLPGHIGTNDVLDCMACLEAAAQTGLVDTERVAVMGGSHGGFLTGNLVGQFPDQFKCAVLRNPVMDISLMIHVSDIPDWTYVEAFGSKEGLKRMRVKPTKEDLERFKQVSPIAHVDSVKAPLMFMLGAKDRRVPMQDAKQYLAAIRSRTDVPETKIFVFPEDTHALDKTQTEFEQFLNAAWWFQRHLQRS